MKIKKNFIYAILIMLIIVLPNVKVNAATGDSYVIKLNSDKTALSSGETITMTLNVSDINIQSGDKGIGAYEGTISYDTNVFTDMKITGNDKWDTPVENGGKFTSVKSDGICTSEAQTLLKIELTVKDNATIGNTTIQIKNFKASNALESISTSDTSLTVKIEKNATSSNTNSTDGQNSTSTSGTNSASGQNSTSTQKNTVEINKSVAANKIPYAGASKILVYFVVILIIVGVFCYIKYKRTY